ncbi:MAG: rRNA maturation RNase YbeY [bacterium]
MPKEKLRNKTFFQCHFVPKQLVQDINIFLDKLIQNDTFLFELNKCKEFFSIEINFLDEIAIRKLNLEYRDIDNSTDVLSFNLGPVGEIDLCFSIIEKNAIDLKISSKEELFRCIIHGILHILGYDHISKLDTENLSQEEMFLLQENILKNVTSGSL